MVATTIPAPCHHLHHQNITKLETLQCGTRLSQSEIDAAMDLLLADAFETLDGWLLPGMYNQFYANSITALGENGDVRKPGFRSEPDPNPVRTRSECVWTGYFGLGSL